MKGRRATHVDVQDMDGHEPLRTGAVLVLVLLLAAWVFVVAHQSTASTFGWAWEEGGGKVVLLGAWCAAAGVAGVGAVTTSTEAEVLKSFLFAMLVGSQTVLLALFVLHDEHAHTEFRQQGGVEPWWLRGGRQTVFAAATGLTLASLATIYRAKRAQWLSIALFLYAATLLALALVLVLADKRLEDGDVGLQLRALRCTVVGLAWASVPATVAYCHLGQRQRQIRSWASRLFGATMLLLQLALVLLVAALADMHWGHPAAARTHTGEGLLWAMAGGVAVGAVADFGAWWRGEARLHQQTPTLLATAAATAAAVAGWSYTRELQHHAPPSAAVRRVRRSMLQILVLLALVAAGLDMCSRTPLHAVRPVRFYACITCMWAWLAHLAHVDRHFIAAETHSVRGLLLLLLLCLQLAAAGQICGRLDGPASQGGAVRTLATPKHHTQKVVRESFTTRALALLGACSLLFAAKNSFHASSITVATVAGVCFLCLSPTVRLFDHLRCRVRTWPAASHSQNCARVAGPIIL